ncbi:MAG: 16S rRNA (guanine(966)-N(2))-methyltransferase RsmD [Candidatus Delongbacteria bacterium]
MIRITGGKLKGRNLESFRSHDLRPTTAFFREWIFNVIKNMIDIDRVVLMDLFSGTGAVSFEFISRNARSAVMIEKNRDLVNITEKNMNKMNVNNAEVISSDAISYLQRSFDRGIKLPYNVIYMDPPYNQGHLIDQVLNACCNNCSYLPQDIMIIIESRKEKNIPASSDLICSREKISGATKMSIFRRKDA